MAKHCLLILIGMLTTFSETSHAKPDLRRMETLNGIQIYPDHAKSWLYYVGPRDLELATSDEGQPKFHLLSTVFTGRLITGDRGQIVRRNLVSFHVRIIGPTPVQTQQIRTELTSRRRGRATELRALPISRLLAHVVYTPVHDEEKREKVNNTTLPKGQFEKGKEVSEGYWTERTYTLRLSGEDAQVLRQALEEGRVLLSLSYAFVAKGIGMEVPLEEVTGSPELTALIKPDSSNESVEPAREIARHVVKADAIAITLDAKRWPELLKKIDINEDAPPDYAVLEIYCYDFQQNTRPDLFEKQIDIQAKSVNGVSVYQRVLFNADEPDRYAHMVRFPVAVRLDQPYRYRVREIYLDGSEVLVQEWTESKSWVALLDVTRAKLGGGGGDDVQR